MCTSWLVKSLRLFAWFVCGCGDLESLVSGNIRRYLCVFGCLVYWVLAFLCVYACASGSHPWGLYKWCVIRFHNFQLPQRQVAHTDSFSKLLWCFLCFPYVVLCGIVCMHCVCMWLGFACPFGVFWNVNVLRLCLGSFSGTETDCYCFPACVSVSITMLLTVFSKALLCFWQLFSKHYAVVVFCEQQWETLWLPSMQPALSTLSGL